MSNEWLKIHIMHYVIKPIRTLPLYLTLIACVAPTLADTPEEQVTLPVLTQKVIAPLPTEEPDLPRIHWAYQAINKLGQAGVLEINEDSVFQDYRTPTRYTFVVDLARLLLKAGIIQGASTLPVSTRNGICNLREVPIPQSPNLAYQKKDITNILTRRECIDVITALMMEFGDDLARIGVRGVSLNTCENNDLVNKKPMDK